MPPCVMSLFCLLVGFNDQLTYYGAAYIAGNLSPAHVILFIEAGKDRRCVEGNARTSYDDPGRRVAARRGRGNQQMNRSRLGNYLVATGVVFSSLGVPCEARADGPGGGHSAT